MGSAIGKGLGAVTGQINPILSPLGLGGEQGEYYQPTGAPQMDMTAINDMAERQKYRNDVGSNMKLAQYGTGGMTLAEALASEGGPGVSGLRQDEWRRRLATDPLTGSRMASEQVQMDPILKTLFGKGGAMERADTEERDLASRGFSLRPEDHEAYGQASGEIARMFGQQEQSLAQSLANRGLASGASGAALSGYAGLQGNKLEQLAAAQRKIADDRMNMNLQRLNSTRSYLSGLGQQGASAIDNQYYRNLAGVQNAQGQNESYADMLARKQAQDLNTWQAQNQMAQDSLNDKRGAKGQTLFDAAGQGLFSGVKQGVASRVGGAVGGPGSGASQQSAPEGDPRQGQPQQRNMYSSGGNTRSYARS